MHLVKLEQNNWIAFRMKKTSQSAFTIAEISIVLLILALMSASIAGLNSIAGQAKIRAVISEFNQLRAAYNSFKLKFDAYPGDMTNATTIFGSTDVNGNTVYNGDGDGLIGAWWRSQENYSEHQQLALAGFISGMYTGNMATGPVAGTTFMGSKNGKNTIYWTYPDSSWGMLPKTNYIMLSTEALNWAGVAVNDAKMIDDKMDDGLPYQGQMISYGNNNAGGECVITHVAQFTSASLFRASTLPYLVNSGTTCAMLYYIDPSRMN
jgi:type II secretory pathway pseudopilin PulG